jgi:hypothetical protein
MTFDQTVGTHDDRVVGKKEGLLGSSAEGGGRGEQKSDKLSHFCKGEGMRVGK